MPKISARNLAEHRAETVERLLDAFGELVMTRGYDGVSLADVAAHIDLARTAIYNYFPDRPSLLLAWTDREVHRTLEALEDEISKAETCAEKLEIFVRTQLDAFANRHLPPGQEAGQMLGRESYGRFMDHIEPLEKALAAIIVEGIGRGEFGNVDVSSTVPLMLGAIGAERGPLSTGSRRVEDSMVQVTAFLLAALGVDGSAPRRKRKRSTSD